MIIVREIKKYSSFLFFFILSVLISSWNVKAKAKEDIGIVKDSSDYDVLHIRGNYWLYFNDASNSLYHYLAEQAFHKLDKRAKKISGLNTIENWQQRQEYIKETLLDICRPFPEKTPLNARITRIIKKEGFRVEHIIYESQPKFYVTSSMFIPDGLKNKAPVVIFCIGHSNSGTHIGGQQIILNLVKKGFIVFSYDPVGQGERIEFFNTKSGKSILGGATQEHSYSGTQAFITGSSLSRYSVWDGIRAVDYLMTREEVDPARIGITGGSGGGTQSAQIAALDERIYAAAPERYITNYTRLLQSLGPTDAEQSFLNAIARGLDHADLLLVRAPKPAMMITTTGDFFSIQGARETAKEVSSIYNAYGKEENFSMVEDDALHASTKKNREAMYAFFQRHLKNPGNSNDEDVPILSKEDMRVTNTGQVSTSLEGETVFSLNSKEAGKLIDILNVSRNDRTKHFPAVLKAAKKLSGYHEPVFFYEPVFTGRINRKTYTIEKYFVKGEGDYIIPYLLMIPEKSNHKALIYLHPSGKAAEASVGGEMEWFVLNGFTVIAPDLLGIGETGPGHSWGSAVFDGINLNIWFGSILIGRSIVGIRAGDVVRIIELIKKYSNISEVYGFARKEMAPIMLYTAVFDPHITRIALIEPYSSYRSIVLSNFYNPQFIYSSVAGALKAYDLPDLAASLAPRRLLLIDPTDGLGNENQLNIKDDLNVIKSAYDLLKASDQLEISRFTEIGSMYVLYQNWIK